MDETAKEHNRSANQQSFQPASRSPLSSPGCSSIQTWLPVQSPPRPPWMNDRQMEQAHATGMQSSPPSRFYEELYCMSQTSNALPPLAGALLTSSEPQSDVVKQGYLGKLDRNHRRYFVLRAGSHTGPSRLEWYKSQEKFTAMEKSAGKAALFGSNKQGVIYLRCCLGVSRIGSSKKGPTVALYAKDQTMVLVVEDQWEQDEWYLAMKKLMEEERKDEERGEGFDEDDDGYCTLPPASFFKEVWPVRVKPRGLGCSKSLAGESRLCLTATSLILVRVSTCSDLPSLTIPLLSVRRFGHLDGSFFLELGRSAPNGPGEIWMEARDQGNAAVAQHIHEVVRETVRALRALPDFSRSPTSSSQLQTFLASKRCRPKYRDKPANVRPLGSRPILSPRASEIQASPIRCHREAHKPELESSLSSTSHFSPLRSRQGSTPDTGGYMEMMINHHLPVSERRAARGTKGWEPGEEKEEGPVYMMMSPQVSHSPPVLPQDDYMTMTSPHKHDRPTFSSPSSLLQTSFSSSISDSYSPLRPSYHHTSERSPPHWPLTSVRQSESGQSQVSISCSTRPQEDDAEQEQKSANQRRVLPPVSSTDGSNMMTPYVASGPDCTGSIQVSPTSGTARSVRRYRLSLCLPSCLQA